MRKAQIIALLALLSTVFFLSFSVQARMTDDDAKTESYTTDTGITTVYVPSTHSSTTCDQATTVPPISTTTTTLPKTDKTINTCKETYPTTTTTTTCRPTTTTTTTCRPTTTTTTTCRPTTTTTTTACRPTTTTISTSEMPQRGVIRVVKVNADPSMGNYSLAGAVFEVRDPNGTLVDTITTDGNGIATTIELPHGSYDVTEIIAPYGFIRNPNSFSIQLTP